MGGDDAGQLLEWVGQDAETTSEEKHGASGSRESSHQESETSSVLRPHTGASGSTCMAQWMWGDGRLFKRSSHRWSRLKNIEDTVSELQACRPKDLLRPVVMKVLPRGEDSGDCAPEEQFPDVASSITHLNGLADTAGPSSCETDRMALPAYTQHELRVKLVSANSLATPSYRLGDETRYLLAGSGSLLRSVYVVLELGGQVLETKPAENRDGTDVIKFDGPGGLMIFKYRGERELRIAVKNHRRVSGIVRGDPLIGEAVLYLEDGLLRGKPQQCAVAIKRRGTARGNLRLNYTLVQRRRHTI